MELALLAPELGQGYWEIAGANPRGLQPLPLPPPIQPPSLLLAPLP